jgi:hypothetical protein
MATRRLNLSSPPRGHFILTASKPRHLRHGNDYLKKTSPWRGRTTNSIVQYLNDKRHQLSIRCLNNNIVVLAGPAALVYHSRFASPDTAHAQL